MGDVDRWQLATVSRLSLPDTTLGLSRLARSYSTEFTIQGDCQCIGSMQSMQHCYVRQRQIDSCLALIGGLCKLKAR